MTALAPRAARLPLDPPCSRPARANVAAVVLAVLALCLGGFAVTASPASAAAASETDVELDLNLFEDRILAIVNKHRKAADLKPVRSVSRCVDRFSERWARHLAETGEFVHRDQKRILRRCDLTWVGEVAGATSPGSVRTSSGAPGSRPRVWCGPGWTRPVTAKS